MHEVINVGLIFGFLPLVYTAAFIDRLRKH